MTKLSEILSGPETWCQRAYKSADGQRHCLVGAVHELLDWSQPDVLQTVFREEQRLEEIVWARAPHIYSAMQWNDEPERVWDEIAEVRDEFDRDRLLRP